MPSSMIFTGLVVLWLIVLVPTIARHRQEVERPSVAALSGRVLSRPQRHHSMEVGRMAVHEDVRTRQGVEPGAEAPVVRVPAARTGAEPASSGPRVHTVDDHADAAESFDEPGSFDDREGADGRAAEDDRGWERPPSRYRPGRGGFDADAALVTARARYAFRQRVVLALLIGALVTGVVAAVSVKGLWWAHGTLDLVLVGYLGYLRRQVRMEDAIRNRRSARLAGGRHRPDTDDRAPDDRALDAWAGSGRGAAARAAAAAENDEAGRPGVDDGAGGDVAEDVIDRGSVDRGSANTGSVNTGSVDDGSVDLDGGLPPEEEPEPERVAGTGEPVGLLRVLPETVEQQTALPRLLPAPPPPLPAGTALVEADDADLALATLDLPHRRAVGE